MFFCNKQNPFPEPVEGNMFAKGYRFFVGVKFFFATTKKPPPSVTLNSFQGLCKLWLYVLQIPNQVRDDGSLLKWRFCVGKAFFSKTKNPLPEALEGSSLQRNGSASMGAVTALWYK